MENNARIVIVEDDDTIALGLVQALRFAGYEVRHFDRGETALDGIAEWKPNLVPRRNASGSMGSLCSSICARRINLPVIMLTAKTGGMTAGRPDSGADDYVTKPFSARELLARVRARMRTATLPQKKTTSSSATTWPTCGEVIRKGEKEIRLTTHEGGTGLPDCSSWAGCHPQSFSSTSGDTACRCRPVRSTTKSSAPQEIELVPADLRHILTIHALATDSSPEKRLAGPREEPPPTDSPCRTAGSVRKELTAVEHQGLFVDASSQGWRDRRWHRPPRRRSASGFADCDHAGAR